MTAVTIDIFIFQMFGMILENPRWSLGVNVMVGLQPLILCL